MTISGAMREMVAAYFMGTSPFADAYSVIAFYLDSAYVVLHTSVASMALVPVLADEFARDRRKGENLALSVGLGVTGLTILGLLVISVFIKPVADLLLPGFGARQSFDFYALLRLSLPALLLVVVASVIAGVLQANQRYSPPIVGRVAFNLVVIATFAFFSKSNGLNAVVMGLVIGALLQAAFQFAFLRRHGFSISFDGIWHPRLREIILLSLPSLTMMLLWNVFRGNWERYLVSGLAVGSLSSLNYAFRILTSIATLGLALMTVGFTRMAVQLGGEITSTEADQTLQRTFHVGIFILIPASVLLYLLAQPIISLVFERGEFGQESVLLTAAALRLYAMSAFPGFAYGLLMRAFFAYRQPLYPLGITIGSTLILVSADLWLVARIGYLAIPIGYLIGLSLGCALSVMALKRIRRINLVRELWPFTVKVIIISFLASLLLVMAPLNQLEQVNSFGDALWLMIAIVGYLGLYAFLAWLIKIPEAIRAVGILDDILARRWSLNSLISF